MVNFDREKNQTKHDGNNMDDGVDTDNTIEDEDYQCGTFFYHPQWLQKFASKKVFTVALAVFGLVLYGEMSSFQGSLSSLEKNFSISAKTVSSFKLLSQASSIFTSLTLTYFADRGNKLRWIAFSAILFIFGIGISIIPLFTPISLQNINAYILNGNSSLRNLTQEKKECNFEDKYELYHYYILIPFIIGQILFGIGIAIHRTCGFGYMDDNIKKSHFSIFYSIIYSMQWFGYSFGLLIASITIKLFVFPTSKPSITNRDSRWIGAWWLGLLFFGFLCLLTLPVFLLLPQRLRRSFNRPKSETPTILEKSWSDFGKSLKAVLTNKILIMETLSTIAFSWGNFATYWTKYLEVQFDMTSSEASLWQGMAEFISKPLGIFFMSGIIMKYTPRPRILLGWNIVFSGISFIAGIFLIFINCKDQHIRGHMDTYSNRWDLNEQCNVAYNCSYDLKYAPICDTISYDVFFSSCHAGCQSILESVDKTIYNNCKCAINPNSLKEGVCVNDCKKTALIYVVLIAIIKTLKSATRPIKALVEFRSMKETDKSLTLGIIRSIQLLGVAVPGIIVYSWFLDNSCLVWDNKCGARGNCWLYDTDKMRYTFYITSAGTTGICMILDLFIFRMVKSLKFYDEDVEIENKSREIVETQEILLKSSKEKNII